MPLIIVRKLSACFLFRMNDQAPADDVELENLLIRASELTKVAQRACRDWEDGGDPDAVGDTSVDALDIGEKALAALRCSDTAYARDGVPQTRRHRLAEAAYFLLLAGTDEHGTSGDLKMSAELFRRAAIS